MLEGAGLAYELYSNIKPNPTIENVQTGVAALQGMQALITLSRSVVDLLWIPPRALVSLSENPDFADVRSLEGVADTKHKQYADLCSAYDSRYRSRGYDQLRYHGCREES